MQKIIEHQFFCYPKLQELSVLYKDVNYLNNRLFSSLSIQMSPKNGFLQRIRKTKFGHYLSEFLTQNTISISSLNTPNFCIGYKNGPKLLLFDFDKENNPTAVYKKGTLGNWEKSTFLGYTLIEKYTKQEYFSKREQIAIVLKRRWEEILNGEGLHGDFTHFNVLISAEDKIVFIDANSCENSKLFDHFYFYSYYVQCLERCNTISKKDVFEIKNDLQNLIKTICYSKDLESLLRNISTKEAVGLFPLEKEGKIIEFSNFLLKNER